MRQIKFRAKDTFKSKFFPQRWLYGTPVQDGDDMWMCVKKENKGIVSVKVDPNTLGQFTGLTDCNGKEIYEGDIVRFYDEIEECYEESPIKYDDEYCSFVIENSSGDQITLSRHAFYTVCGNIYDNPELISQPTEV